jgi:hypothetical protein
MPTVATMLKQLQAQRDRAESEITQLDEAIAALKKLDSPGRANQRGRPPGRKVSASTRKKMAASQKARWAKRKKQKGSGT